jgi:acyl carrier protein
MPAAMQGPQPSSETSEWIRGFLIDRGDWHGARAELTDDLPLLHDLLDSLAVPDLVLAIESEHGIALADDDLDPSNFATIAKISALIEARRT